MPAAVRRRGRRSYDGAPAAGTPDGRGGAGGAAARPAAARHRTPGDRRPREKPRRARGVGSAGCECRPRERDRRRGARSEAGRDLRPVSTGQSACGRAASALLGCRRWPSHCCPVRSRLLEATLIACAARRRALSGRSGCTAALEALATCSGIGGASASGSTSRGDPGSPSAWSSAPARSPIRASTRCAEFVLRVTDEWHDDRLAGCSTRRTRDRRRGRQRHRARGRGGLVARRGPPGRRTARGARRGDPRASPACWPSTASSSSSSTASASWSAPSTRRSASSTTCGVIERFITSGITPRERARDRRRCRAATACWA